MTIIFCTYLLFVEHLGNFFLKSVIDNSMVNIFVQIGYNLKNVSPDKFSIFMFIMFYFMWYFTLRIIYFTNTYIVLALCARKVKWLAQSHKASKWLSRLAPESLLLEPCYDTSFDTSCQLAFSKKGYAYFQSI